MVVVDGWRMRGRKKHLKLEPKMVVFAGESMLICKLQSAG
jgi:hypothetical protein